MPTSATSRAVTHRLGIPHAAAATSAAARERFAALSAICVDLALFLPLAYVLNIGQDEAYTLHTTARGIGYAFHQALTFELNAPLYFVLIALWRHIDDSLFFLRLFSIGCIVLTVAVIPPIARRYLPTANVWIVTMAVAWNPLMAWAALETRVYAMAILLSALLLLSFYDAFITERPRRYTMLLYALLCAVSLYTEYYLGFLIASQFIVLLLFKPKALGRYVVSGLATLAAFAPMIAIVPAQAHSYSQAFQPPSLLRSCAVMADIVAHDVLPLLFHGAPALYAVIALAILCAAAMQRRFLQKNAEPLLPVMLVVAAFVFAAATYVARVDVSNRHAAGLYVLSVMGTFGVFAFVRPRLRKRVVFVWFCAVMLASSIAIAQTYWQGAKPGDWIRVNRALQARERPGEPIAIFEAENALPFVYYYRGPNRVTPVPAAIDFNNYGIEKFAVRSDAQLRRSMPSASRIWLITAGYCNSGSLEFGCGLVERYVGRHYRILYDASFYYARLRLLAEKPE
jgi:hypothetical protein